MFVHINETPESAGWSVPRLARQEQRRRNTAARRKLEALRERTLLRKQLTDVWDEPGNRCQKLAANVPTRKP